MFRPWRQGMELRPWPLPHHTNRWYYWPPPQPSELGVCHAPYLVGVVFFHPRLAVILVGQERESRVFTSPTPPTVGPGWEGPERLAWSQGSGVRGQG